MVNARPKALIFDVFGTLVDWRGSVAREARSMFGEMLDADAFARAWRARYQPSMENIRNGTRGFVRLDDLHRENLDEILAPFDLTDTEESRLSQLNTAWHRLDPWPDVQEGMAMLRPNFFLAPCSNGNTSLMIRLARHAGLPWDTILGAEPAQDYKPQSKVYLCSADWLGLQPDEVMMVAAHNDDLVAARQAGLQTAFFPRPQEFGNGQTRDLEASRDWDFVATDLVDLAKQLR